MTLFLFTIVALVAGGALGYGLRAEIGKELTELHTEYINEVAALRADVAKIVAEIKAKI